MNAIAEALRSQLAGGVLALSLAGTLVAAGWAFARSAPRYVLALVRRQLMVSVDVVSGDPVFDAIRIYLDRHEYSRKARNLSAAAATTFDCAPPRSSGNDPPAVTFTPAPGNHLLWVGGRPVWLSRDRKENEHTGRLTETLNVRMFGRSQEAARKLFADAMQLVRRESGVGFHIASYGEWRRLLTKRPRSLASVVLRAGQQDRILREIEEYLATEEWYLERGIPYTLGCFFWGAPGGGKNSFVEALAGHLKLDLYSFALGTRSISDATLTNMLLNVPSPCVVLMDDIHTVIRGRKVKGDSDGGVTFPGLLHAIGGIATRPGIIIIVTSNLPPKAFPPELVRDGRFDIKEEFPVCDADQAARAYSIFYPGAAPADAGVFGEACAGRAMAEVQRIMLRAKAGPADALALACAESALDEVGVAGALEGER